MNVIKDDIKSDITFKKIIVDIGYKIVNIFNNIDATKGLIKINPKNFM